MKQRPYRPGKAPEGYKSSSDSEDEDVPMEEADNTQLAHQVDQLSVAAPRLESSSEEDGLFLFMLGSLAYWMIRIR
jgi:hypothetical protein